MVPQDLRERIFVLGFTSVSTVPAGSFGLVGATTVNGPGLFRMSTNPAALAAATKSSVVCFRIRARNSDLRRHP